MDHFTYRGGVLHAEDAPLPEIAAAVGTPFFCYSTATLERHFNVVDQSLAAALGARSRLIAYAVKANSNLAVIKTFARLGAGADVVSEGELRRALAAGVPGERIVFAGVGKTRSEMAFALAMGVSQFNVESAEELEALDSVAREMNLRAPFALRVNPDVDPQTHAKISTGKAETKFGVAISDASALYARAAEMTGLQSIGVDAHIGSQLTDLAPFEAAFARLTSLARELRAAGRRIDRLDFGGGLGIPYVRSNTAPPAPFDYGAAIGRALGDFDADVVVEPGRLLVGNAGVLVSRVIYRKQAPTKTFLILDSAMNDLIRPTLYDAWHDIEPVIEPNPQAPVAPVDVVGPVCETGDLFAIGRPLPPIAAGELVAVRSAGAYAAVMASEYNTRPLAPEVIVHGAQFAVVRPRPTYDEMIGRDQIPEWLSG